MGEKVTARRMGATQEGQCMHAQRIKMRWLGCLAAVLSWMAIPSIGALPAARAASEPRHASVNRLTEVAFEPHEEHLVFKFRAAQPLLPESFEILSQKTALILRLNGVKTDRRWLDFEDPAIMRTLLHPSRSRPPAAVLRVRLHKRPSASMKRHVQRTQVGDELVVRIARNDQVAARWAAGPPDGVAPQAPAEPDPAVQVKIEPEPTRALAVDPRPEAPPASEIGDDLVADRAHPSEPTPAHAQADVASSPITDPDPANEAWPTEPETAADPPSPEADPTEARLFGDPALPVAPSVRPKPVDAPSHMLATSTPDADAGSGAVWALALALIVMAGALFGLRRLRSHNLKNGKGRLIRPLCTHLLGPKHGLMLLDVAGELVLVSTGDKGVEMLTKIEPLDPRWAETLAPGVTQRPEEPAPPPTDREREEVGPTQVNPVSRFAHVFGQIRDAAGQAMAVRRQAGAESATSDSGPVDPTPPNPGGDTALSEAISSNEVERDFFAREPEDSDDDALTAMLDAVKAAGAADVVELAPNGRRPTATARTAEPRPDADAIPIAVAGDPKARMESDILTRIRQLQSA